MIRSEKSKVCDPQQEGGRKCANTGILTGSADALRCIAWGGRALVVGFAGGAIEQVRALSG